MKDLKIFLVFIVGFAVGIAIGSIFSDLLEPYLPEILKPKFEEIEGKVTAKQTKHDKLLFTVSTPPGAILVTFSEKVPEVDLLIETGDMITLGLYQYEPFVTNPTIKKVRKGEQQEDKTESGETPDDSGSPLPPEAGSFSEEAEEEVLPPDPIAF